MRDIFDQEDDPELVVQRERWGPLDPKRTLIPSLGIPVDFFFLRANELHDAEDAETEAFKALLLQNFSNSQNEHGNGMGSQATSSIFVRRVNELLNLDVFQVQASASELTPAKNYCAQMDQQLRSKMLGSSTGPIVIAFDEIGATRKLFPGLWYQFGHFQQYQNFRLQELFTQHPSDNHKDTRDLYLAFIVLIRTLRGRYGFDRSSWTPTFRFMILTIWWSAQPCVGASRPVPLVTFTV